MDRKWSLQGKRAVVTEGTKGIGRATAEALLDLGGGPQQKVSGRACSR
jgi:NAD(P)-dependent dehydrogenase (short-subunit alcohol dehydrogenase family)